jgi:hypothetical protein
MNANSIEKSETPESFIEELKLLVSTPKTSRFLCVVVEGDSDAKLFKSILDEKSYIVKAVRPSGCLHLERSIETLSKQSDQFIGIRDADFYHLESKKPECKAVLLTDTHDLETLILKSNEVIKKLICENNLDQEIDEFRNFVFSIVKFVGYVRWYSHKNNSELTFKALKIHHFINENTKSFKADDFIDKLLEASPNSSISKEELFPAINSLVNDNHDIFQICCGHDVVNGIFKHIKNKSGNALGIHEIERLIRVAYTKDDFSKTNLNKELVQSLKKLLNESN